MKKYAKKNYFITPLDRARRALSSDVSVLYGTPAVGAVTFRIIFYSSRWFSSFFNLGSETGRDPWKAKVTARA
jgi:hypothetical protein